MGKLGEPQYKMSGVQDRCKRNHPLNRHFRCHWQPQRNKTHEIIRPLMGSIEQVKTISPKLVSLSTLFRGLKQKNKQFKWSDIYFTAVEKSVTR